MNTLHEKVQSLNEQLLLMESVLVAFSGGVDSTFLLSKAKEVLGENIIAVTARSSTYPLSEFAESQRLSKSLGVEHVVIDSEELDIPEFSQNPVNRCYFCKAELFSKLVNIAKLRNIKSVVDGTNFDDLSDHRPGMEAAIEYGIKSPLKDAHLTKKDIRDLSRNAGLDTWEKPSFACLASRFPYGDTITKEKLEKIDEAESYLRSQGFKQVRVRHHGAIARIELDENDKLLGQGKLCADIVSVFKKIGFAYITIDIEGYRTGSMNETINEK